MATFIERKTRFYIAVKMPDRSSESMLKAIKLALCHLPKEMVKTLTVDRGKEFGCYKEIEESFNILVYFADPYSSWRRGSNGNANGLLREFFPKKTKFSNVSEDKLREALNLINNRPRKCLNWYFANEAFNWGVN